METERENQSDYYYNKLKNLIFNVKKSENHLIIKIILKTEI